MKNLVLLLSTGSASSRHLAFFPVLDSGNILVLMTCLWVYLLYHGSRFFLYMNLYISCNNMESVGYCIKYVVCFDALIELFDSMGTWMHHGMCMFPDLTLCTMQWISLLQHRFCCCVLHMFVLSAWLASGFAMADDGKQLALAAPLIISEAGTRKIPSVGMPGQPWSARAWSGNFLAISIYLSAHGVKKKGSPSSEKTERNEMEAER